MSDYGENFLNLPSIEEISIELPAISEYCEISRLPDLFKHLKIDTLPVIDIKGKLVGIISEYDLAKILPEWSFDSESYLHEKQVYELMTRNVWSEKKETSISGLLSKVNEMHNRVIPIVEEDGTYTGEAFTRTAIVHYLTQFARPRSLGGLATPLGVYITDGKHQAGSGNFGLFLTGTALGTIIFFVQLIVFIILGESDIESFDSRLIPLILIGQIALFLLILRFTPLAKIHAAEHQTINAIEKGMPLTIETVKSQPKEHIRCGTNLMVLIFGIQLIILVYASYLTSINPLLQFIFLIIGFSFVFSNWKKWGMLLQKYFTTVKASDRYIKSGIKAGEEILRENKEDVSPKSPSFYKKVWNMGLFQIIFGFITINYVLRAIQNLLNLSGN